MGIDPGSIYTGFGVVAMDSFSKIRHVDSGRICCGRDDFSVRMLKIFEGLESIIISHRPCCIVLEQVFVNKNVMSSLKLAHARGVALLAAAKFADSSIHEYTPRQVKKAVTGNGASNKEKVQEMVKILLDLSVSPSTDAADALALAISHAHQDRFTIQVEKGS